VPSRPNILLITTDEQRYDAAGFNGNARVLTPNLDQLAGESVRFTRHTCSVPLCTPARASLLTGQYARTHGAWHVGVKLPVETRGLSHWLSDAGYATGLFGKAHFEGEMSGYVERLPANEPYYGFTQHAITEDKLDGPYVEWLRREHPQHLAAALDDSHEDCRPSPWPACEQGGLKEAYASDTPEHLRQTAWITDRTMAFMGQQRDAGRPFFAWCSYVAPHHPWNPPRAFAELYDPATLPTPSREPGAFGRRENGYCYRPSMSDSERRRMAALYYALVSHIDHHVGRMLAWMKQQGLLENTLVVFTSDHGDFNGDYGMIRKSELLYDCLLRVPLLVRLPSGRGGGRVHHGPTQHEDIAPTLLEMLNLDAPPSVQGMSFAGVLAGAERSLRRESWFEYHMPKSPGQVLGVERDGWKLVQYPDEPERVLTNRTEDPQEMRNLTGTPEAAEVSGRLIADLLEWSAATPQHRLPKTWPW
jgi:arylsulfatase